MQPESMTETFRSDDAAGAFAGTSRPANDPMDMTGAQQRWLRFEAAGYIAKLLGELAAMARAAELQHLSYFLDMARQEAAAQAQRLQRER